MPVQRVFALRPAKNRIFVDNIHDYFYKGTGRGSYFEYDSFATVLMLKTALAEETSCPVHAQAVFIEEEDGSQSELHDDSLLGDLPVQRCVLQRSRVCSFPVELSGL